MNDYETQKFSVSITEFAANASRAARRIVLVNGPKPASDKIADAIVSYDVLLDALDPDTLEAVADEITLRAEDAFYHSARAGSLRGIAKRMRKAEEFLDGL